MMRTGIYVGIIMKGDMKMERKHACPEWHGQIIVILLVIAIGIIKIQCAWADPSESKPAVSAINAKVSGGYADFDSKSAGFGSASVTLPLTHSIGFSIDGLGGKYDSDSLWGVGGNLFWRNPDKGLIGIIGSKVQAGAASVSRGGATGELYLDRFSLFTDIGYQAGDIKQDGVFSDIGLRWYAVDNLALSAGCAYSGGVTAGVIGMEYMPAFKVVPGIALFVNGSWGQGDYHSVVAGVKYYFGKENKTLKARHREDDPENSALNGLVFGGQAGFVFRPEPEPEFDLRRPA
jgi:hypothetical protein